MVCFAGFCTLHISSVGLCMKKRLRAQPGDTAERTFGGDKQLGRTSKIVLGIVDNASKISGQHPTDYRGQPQEDLAP
jgi:hypothetical protein